MTHGLRCGSPALRGQRMCYYHKQVRRRPVARIPVLDGLHSIKLAVQNITQLMLKGELSGKEAGAAIYGMHLATHIEKLILAHPLPAGVLVTEEPAEDRELDRDPEPVHRHYKTEYDLEQAYKRHYLNNWELDERRQACTAAPAEPATGFVTPSEKAAAADDVSRDSLVGVGSEGEHAEKSSLITGRNHDSPEPVRAANVSGLAQGVSPGSGSSHQKTIQHLLDKHKKGIRLTPTEGMLVLGEVKDLLRPGKNKSTVPQSVTVACDDK